MASGSRRFWFAATCAVVVRPWLWWIALRQAARLAPRRWWARAPFLPVPDARVLEFRMATAYGASGRPAVDDFLAYLEWCRTRA